MKKTLLVALAIIAFSAVGASAGPVVLAGVPGGGTYWNTGAPGVAGYEFIANANMSVIQLGIYDYEGNGLVNSHGVGLWDSAGNLITSVTVPSAAGAPLSNGYRWMTATAPLTIGSHYVLGAAYIVNDIDYFRDTASIDSHFTLVGDLFYDGAGLNKPIGPHFFPNDGRAWYGPNLQAVPDGGATLALLGGALIGLGALRRKYRG